MTTIQNPIELTLYVVGNDPDHALEGMPWDADSFDDAHQYAQDNGGQNVYSVSAFIDPSTIEPAPRGPLEPDLDHTDTWTRQTLEQP